MGRTIPYLIGPGRPDGAPRWRSVVAEKEQGDKVSERATAVVTQTKPKTQKPSMYRVLILNDDYTPDGVCHLRS